MTREEAIKKMESLKISLPAAKDEISEIIELIKTPWISVKDDLPCNHEELIDKEKNMTKRVLVIGKDGKSNVTTNIMSMFYIENCWQWACEIYFKVTHWTPIPNLPKE